MTLPLYYETSGHGPDLVLLHGWGLHGGIFEPLVEQLTKHFRVTNIDLPGFGRSPLPTDDYSIQMMVDKVLEISPEQSNWLGWSLGGLVATHVAAEHASRVDRLITVASNPHFIQRDDWPHAMRPEVMNSFVELLEEDYELTLIRFLLIQTMGSETQKADVQRLKEQVFLHGQPAKKALRGGLEILHGTDLRTKLPEIKQPFLRLYGKLDGLVPAKAVSHIDALSPSSESHIFDKASHAPFLSHPELFVERLLGFVKQNPLK